MAGTKESESIEEYLETMCRLAESGEKLSTGNIAKMLGVSHASVSEMVKKLERDGYVRHTPYRGAELTEKGRALGNKILRRHRLIERFLERVGMRRSRIHNEACRLEHAVSDELETILKKDLGPAKPGLTNLIDVKSGQRAEIVSLECGDKAARRLEDMGLTPGAVVNVTRSAPFSGPVEVCIRDSCLVIGRGMAMKIFVKVKK